MNANKCNLMQKTLRFSDVEEVETYSTGNKELETWCYGGSNRPTLLDDDKI